MPAKAGYSPPPGGNDWGAFEQAQPVPEVQSFVDPNEVYAGPASGVLPGLPFFRHLVSADLPDPFVVNTLYIGQFARFVALPNGIKLEVFDVGLDAWVEMWEYTQ